ncbi:MAG: metal-dependent enzyme-like protein [Cyanobacteria bacterium RYN_339]|nr:metal-dependent enzyme-like protein [Cyanobacteria bacterium RYN_339]
MSLLNESVSVLPARTDLVPRDLVVAGGPTLHATDGLGKVLRNFVEVGTGVLPVVEGERLVGVLVEADVLDWLADHAPSLERLDAGAGADLMVMHLMRTHPVVAFADESISQVLPMFEQKRYKALPVLDTLDRYQGMLTRATVLAALTDNLRPASVGGMATPLGVYLTTGHVSAGVGFWGLFLSGVVLGMVNWLIELSLMHGQRLAGVTLPEPVQALVALGMFLLALRLSPLAGYHAAEHQTVNAIEKGEPLELEAIAAMPREHPRCGTNLMALLFGVQLLLPLVAHEPLLTLPVVVIGALAWRKVGTLLQRYFTTRPPRRYQLRNGQRAGQRLLAAYAARPGYRVDRWRRVWNMGLVQILAGAFTVIAVCEAANQLFPASRGILF